MVNSCVVWGCVNRHDGNVNRRFYDIPRPIKHQGSETEKLSRERRLLWLARINRQGFNPDPTKRHYKVCSDHFISGEKAELYDRTNPDWAPSLKLIGPDTTQENHVPTDGKLSRSAVKRYKRAQDRKQKREQHHAAQALLDLRNEPLPETLSDCTETASSATPCHFTLKGCLEQADNTAETENCDIMAKMNMELQRLTLENMELQESLGKTVFSPDTLKNDEAKVKHYTGLTFTVLMALFQFLSPCISVTAKSSVTKFGKLMLVLMKLRLNLSLQDLGYRFTVSTSCVSKIFNEMIHIMYIRMKGLIMWPEREELQMSMPMEFRKYFGVKVSIVIDCFEIFIERPSNLLARAQTWSNYKHHNTVKILIGITPQGAVSFLSKGWGGRATDKFITENCGLLHKLLPGDIVLADRGFDIKESVGLMCAEVKIPAFTKGKKQLSPVELEATRKIAHNRIHVERVIGLVRNKYTILQSTLPIDYLHSTSDTAPTIDKIVTVCCALSNMCPSVVPFD
ncbi:PREDICTED: uncharacterized protein LOC106819777 [Priapulus caudatus]|uniref:Uncharacterized protein LOC106819777 n=1 Tax=Priapulus caudatus TaxID=37621 RepID=A0ABM1F5X9_PRICU|nr:PREDICTED: uncharacterized protein LOC106819777 [Priapulus caudatus]